MVSSADVVWLSAKYPDLVPSDNDVVGTIEFTATYNHDLNRFLILGDDVPDDVGGVRLTCKNQIRIAERLSKGYSRLPALHVSGLDLTDDRHFAADQSACLCSPIEEQTFLEPSFEFRMFLEQLVIPFLYGQKFYSEYRHWPWMEYAHGVTGLLESFADAPLNDRADILRFINTVAMDSMAWPQVRAVLHRGEAKGHTACFCPKHDHIRRCHPKALAGLRRLLQKVEELSVQLP